jgi:hypothetical protein
MNKIGVGECVGVWTVRRYGLIDCFLFIRFVKIPSIHIFASFVCSVLGLQVLLDYHLWALCLNGWLLVHGALVHEALFVDLVSIVNCSNRDLLQLNLPAFQGLARNRSRSRSKLSWHPSVLGVLTGGGLVIRKPCLAH